MKRTVILSTMLAVALGAVAQTSTPTPAAKKPQTSTATGATKKTPATGAKAGTAAKKSADLTTPRGKASYAVGENLGKMLKSQEIDVDPEIVGQAIKDVMQGKKAAITDEEAKAALLQLQGQVRTKMEAKMKAVADQNKAAGDAFLASNKTKEGIVALPDGLQYKILKEGTGPKPTAADTVECNYRGTLLNGKEFDSSYKRGEAASFALSQVIKGWTEALQLMPVGSKWQLFIPANLAYGERAMGGEIPPNSTLIFEIELLSIKPSTAKQ